MEEYKRIPIRRSTWEQIGRERKGPGETWDDVIRKLHEKIPCEGKEVEGKDER